MSLIKLIRAAAPNGPGGEDGQRARLELMPALSTPQIDELARKLVCPLPKEVRKLLGFCRGFHGSFADWVDFGGALGSYEQAEIFPHGLPIAGDGLGNHWVVDLLPSSKVWGPIYFACH